MNESKRRKERIHSPNRVEFEIYSIFLWYRKNGFFLYHKKQRYTEKLLRNFSRQQIFTFYNLEWNKDTVKRFVRWTVTVIGYNSQLILKTT